jgi:hypothetical protein
MGDVCLALSPGRPIKFFDDTPRDIPIRSPDFPTLAECKPFVKQPGGANKK